MVVLHPVLRMRSSQVLRFDMVAYNIDQSLDCPILDRAFVSLRWQNASTRLPTGSLRLEALDQHLSAMRRVRIDVEPLVWLWGVQIGLVMFDHV